MGYDSTLGSNGAGYIQAVNNGITWTNLILDGSGGSVGIGTTSPNQTLEISSAANYQLRLGNGTSGSAYTYDVGRNTSTGFLNFYGNQTGYVGYVFGGVDRTIMTMLDNGNVGIGTAAPPSPLSIYYSNTSTTTPAFTIDNASSSGQSLMDFRTTGNKRGEIRADSNGNFVVEPAGSGTLYLGGVDAVNGTPGGAMYFFTGNAQQMTINTSGQVGIGTASPGAMLDIETTGGSALKIGAPSFGESMYIGNWTGCNNDWGAIYLNGQESTCGDYNFKATNYNTDVYMNRPTGGHIYFAENDGTPQMTIQSGGDVGIGTASPSYTLHVNGSVAGTSAYNNLSDARLKTDITEITDGLGSVKKLNPIHFHWLKPEKRTLGKDMNLPVNEPQVGFLAQDVEKVVPEAVVTDAKGLYSMEETKLIPVLVEAVKELEAQNEKMSGQISSMAAELKQLKETRPSGH